MTRIPTPTAPWDNELSAFWIWLGVAAPCLAVALVTGWATHSLEARDHVPGEFVSNPVTFLLAGISLVTLFIAGFCIKEAVRARRRRWQWSS